MQKAFQYKALGFVRKNHLVEELPFAVKCVLQEIHKATKCIVLISVQKNKKTKHEVVVSDILYIDTQNHQTTFHLANNTSVVTRESLSSYTSQNAFQGFIQISSGCIVNHIHIYSIEKDTIILLNHEALYISRRRTKTVKEQFLQLSRRLIL
jgi:DNA-binding LytR/AlgR family response regulator